MTKPKAQTASAASIEIERPRRGGSYVRQPDGKLELIESTVEAEADPDAATAPAGDAGITQDVKSEG